MNYKLDKLLTETVNIDLHVHTAFGSPCAELNKPESLLDSLKNRLVHGIVITEHNTMWPTLDIEALNRSLPRDQRIYSGIEVSTSHYHVVVIGLDNPSGIFPGISIEKLRDIAHRHQAVTILVHPYSSPVNGSSSPEFPDVDCIEVASTMTCGDKQHLTRTLCQTKHAIPVAGSDAHCRENIGRAYTAFPSLPRNEKDLARQIKNGLGVPMVRNAGGQEIRVC